MQVHEIDVDAHLDPRRRNRPHLEDACGAEPPVSTHRGACPPPIPKPCPAGIESGEGSFAGIHDLNGEPKQRRGWRGQPFAAVAARPAMTMPGRIGRHSVAMIWAHTATMPRNRARDARVAASAITTRITVSLQAYKEQHKNYVPVSFQKSRGG